MHLNSLLAAIAAVAALAAPAVAQDAAPSLSLGVGTIAFGHARGTEIAAGRASIPLSQSALLDVGVSLIPGSGDNSPAGDSINVDFLFPDIGLNLQPSSGAFRPYVGAGMTLALDLRRETSATFGAHACVGARLALSPRWGLRIDGRVRALGGTYGTSREITFAVTWVPRARVP